MKHLVTACQQAFVCIVLTPVIMELLEKKTRILKVILVTLKTSNNQIVIH